MLLGKSPVLNSLCGLIRIPPVCRPEPPSTPQVTFKHHSWTLNQTLTVLCQAEAGIPPQEFLWYYKAPNMRNFQIVERQNEAVYYHEDGCRVTSRRALHVRVTSESGGIVYRCALPGRVEEETLYDEITVRLPPREFIHFSCRIKNNNNT